jgi:acid-sensing ion channel, other
MFSDKFTGPGHLQIKVLSECFLYTMGYYEVPNLITPKTDILQIDQFIRYT